MPQCPDSWFFKFIFFHVFEVSQKKWYKMLPTCSEHDEVSGVWSSTCLSFPLRLAAWRLSILSDYETYWKFHGISMIRIPLRFRNKHPSRVTCFVSLLAPGKPILKTPYLHSYSLNFTNHCVTQCCMCWQCVRKFWAGLGAAKSLNVACGAVSSGLCRTLQRVPVNSLRQIPSSERVASWCWNIEILMLQSTNVK